ncbi:MAG TPA: enoyl-CoA hydratase/isomerase family protein [Rhizobiales bacterium]|nr:enoyl-CoA hydratase/isomerase family protein [Hyphomicrobiales bacterium]
MDFGGGDEIRFERIGAVGLVTMTRARALNAVTHRMVRALSAALEAWEGDGDVALVVIRGEGRAFSAGGDILDIYRAGLAGSPPVGFFADEYRLNARIARFGKPYVALVDGIVMGGGVGVSFHGSHRVMTENAVFAMPEVGIGFFPDVGGSHILSRLKDGFGMYLALTGNRIRRGDALWAGLATHCVPAAAQDALLEALFAGDAPDAAIGRFAEDVLPETDAATRRSIARQFSGDSIEAIVDGLAADADPFAAATLETIRKRSPTSVKVAFRQVRAGAGLSMDACMRMEFRILRRMLAGTDFYEGIRAAIIDKGSTPVWKPATLEEVADVAVDAYFAPLESGDLEL